MKVRALRGVCIGVDRHLQPGDVSDVDASTSQFLVSIQAVEVVAEEPAKPAPTPQPEVKIDESKPESVPAKKPGRKEK